MVVVVDEAVLLLKVLEQQEQVRMQVLLGLLLAQVLLLKLQKKVLFD